MRLPTIGSVARGLLSGMRLAFCVALLGHMHVTLRLALDGIVSRWLVIGMRLAFYGALF